MAPESKRNWLFVVDEEFAEAVCSKGWARVGKGYLYGRQGKSMVYMHRYIWELAFGLPVPRVIDHINGIRWDNRQCNLRAATFSLNGLNNPSNKGVCHYPNRNLAKPYQARIQCKGSTISLGYFATHEEASAAYQKVKEELIRKEEQLALSQPVSKRPK